MAYDFKSLRGKVEDTKGWLQKEYMSIRTGRAAPALLDDVQVESYGALTPLQHVASISIEDARSLRVTPFDMTQVKEIEKAITAADLGVSIGSDERGVRVSFPELTSERRGILQKAVSGKLEEARIVLRRLRDEVWADLQKQEKDKEIGEDEKFRYKDEMQKIIDEGGSELSGVAGRKEKELSS